MDRWWSARRSGKTGTKTNHYACQNEKIGNLETHFSVHMVWIDGTYDMVGVQEQAKYERTSGVEFGPVDVVKYAEAFGASGWIINSAEEIGPVLRKAFERSVRF